MKQKSSYQLTIRTDPTMVTKRATTIVNKLTIDRGFNHHDIARLCDTTVASLLNSESPRLGKIQIKALAKHFDVSILWLVTGHGPEFIQQNQTQPA